MSGRVLVTGASGFIGRQTLEPLLERGFEVHAVARQAPPADDVSWHAADLLDPSARDALVAAVKPTHLLHLAWYAQPGRFWTAPENLDWASASLALYRAFLRHGGERAVLAGSCAQYEWTHDRYREDVTPTRPATLYGVCKQAVEDALSAYASTHGQSLASGRVFFLYGPGEPAGKLVASVLRSLLDGGHVAVTHGRQLRDFLHVADVGAAFAALLARAEVTGPVNIGSGTPIALRELLGELERRVGAHDLIGFGEREPAPGEPPSIVADVTRLRDELGFTPAWTLEAGLDDTIAGGARVISVCIPTYNYGRFLARAIDSVLAQEHDDFELLVVDNASTDDTQAVLARYADPRMRVVRNDVNVGLFGNFRRCLELSDGELVKFLASDDWLAPTYLREAQALLDAHPGAALVSGPGYYVDETDATFGVGVTGVFAPGLVAGADALAAQARWLNVVGMPSNTLIRRAAIEQAGGFDDRFAPAADIHLWGKLLARHDLAWLARPLSYLRFHQTKAHDYGTDPSESTFKVWQDLARREPERVTAQLLRTALDAEAERSLIHASAHLLGRDLAGARRIAAFTAPHAPLPRAIARFALRTPALARAQGARLVAARSGRYVVYGPTPRLGPPLPRGN